MFSISQPELLFLYHHAGRPAPRQVVDPSTGVRSQTTRRPAQECYHKGEEEGVDFAAVFNKALSRSVV
ncbi:MAG: hypothetical protein HQL88_09460 [Magnetococcales bacterium]|nr:hypothetical protein [Magnetococcales bacterium]